MVPGGVPHLRPALPAASLGSPSPLTRHPRARGVPPALAPHQGHAGAADTGKGAGGSLGPLWSGRAGSPGTGGIYPGSPLPAALAHLLAFTILAGLLLATICVAALALLALKLWPR